MTRSIFSIHYNRIQTEFYAQNLGWKRFVPMYFVKRNIVEGLHYTRTPRNRNKYIWDTHLLLTAIKLNHMECARYLIRNECPGLATIFSYVCEHNIEEIATYIFYTHPKYIKFSHLRLFGLKYKHYSLFLHFIHYIPDKELTEAVYYYLFYLQKEEIRSIDLSFLSHIQSRMKEKGKALLFNTIYKLFQFSADVILNVLRLFITEIHNPHYVQELSFSKHKSIFDTLFIKEKVLPIDYESLLISCVQNDDLFYLPIAVEGIPLEKRKLSEDLTYWCTHYSKTNTFEVLVDTYGFVPELSSIANATSVVDERPIFLTRIIQHYFTPEKKEELLYEFKKLKMFDFYQSTFMYIRLDERRVCEFFDYMLQQLTDVPELNLIREKIRKLRIDYLYHSPELNDIITDIKRYIIEGMF